MNKMKRILSIDGGGIKGVVPAAFLATVEETTGKRIIDHFDLIAGSSTGGIIALGLGLGLTANEVLDFYQTKGPQIFSQGGTASTVKRIIQTLNAKALSARRLLLSKYDPATLRMALKEALGERILSESHTRLVIPAFDRQRREVHVFKTSHHPKFVLDFKERAVDVALATAAAPTYLPSHFLDNGISLLDGGIWANNPVGIAAVEAVGVLRWPQDQIHILSIGCTEEAIAIPSRAGILGLGFKMAEILLLGQSRAAIGTAKLLTGHTEDNKRLYRYQHIASDGEFALDATSQISALKGIGASLAREAMAQVDNAFLGTPCDKFIPYHQGRKLNEI
jgi:uncharacterized protein